MSNANPVTGTTKQMRVKECRDIYVTDEMVALVYQCATPVIQDAIDVAYLTARRPSDVLKMRWDHLKDGSLWVERKDQGALKDRYCRGIGRLNRSHQVARCRRHDPPFRPEKASSSSTQVISEARLSLRAIAPRQRRRNLESTSFAFNSAIFGQRALPIWRAWRRPESCWGTPRRHDYRVREDKSGRKSVTGFTVRLCQARKSVKMAKKFFAE